MHRTRKLFATTMIAAAGAVTAALAFSPAAAAQPAPAPAPAPAPEFPGLPMLQQLAANPAAATQLMQSFAGILGGGAPATTATTTPATPVSGPGATASISLPQPVNTMQGTVPTTAAVPGLPGLVSTVPVGNTTTVPATAPAAPAVTPLDGLTDSLGVPGGLASLLPAGNPLASLLPTGTTAPVAAAPVAAPAPAEPTIFTPLAALP